MLRYKIYPYKNKLTEKTGFIARAVNTGTVELDGLATHMAAHNSPFSKGTIKGILEDMVDCITELALDGKSVKIPNLGIFSIGLESKVVEKAEDWTVKDGIASVRLNCRATGDARPINLNQLKVLKEADDYESPLPKTSTSGSSSDSGTTGGTTPGSGSQSSADSGSTSGSGDSGSGSGSGDSGSGDSGSANL